MSTPPLNVLTFPLHGSRLIEASAGTGKTWTIAMLYVRLVLGPPPGADTDTALRPLMPPDILVVTFTDAATQELRSRIRQRLAEAASVFRSPNVAQEAPDHLRPLFELRDLYPSDDGPRLATRLQVAAEWMDQAAISTIHSWCMRMLREHAFGGQALFRQTLATDPAELLAEAARDAWRTFYRDLPAELLREVLGWWASPSHLLKAVRPLLPYATTPDFLRLADALPAELLTRCRALRQQALQTLKAPWSTWTDELAALWQADDAQHRYDRKKFRPQYYEPWLSKLREWAGQENETPLDLGTGWTRLTPAGQAEVYKDPALAPEHPALYAIAQLREQLANLPDAQSDLLRHATVWIRRRFDQAQAQRAQLGFDDLLRQLDGALRAPAGPVLAQTIRQQFPAALIDEFQDTDPLQYRIFDTVYPVAHPVPGTALVLIGDPKQAIYAFRGADIHTYLQARRACADRLYSLGINHRSTTGMVEAVNHCFLQAEARTPGNGAFTYRQADGNNPVPFHRVKAAGRTTQWHPDGAQQPAGQSLTVWYLPPPEQGATQKAERILTGMAQACASTVAGWLAAGRAGFATPRDDGGHDWQPLRPQDVAVLVNHRGEARAIRAALARLGVPSVYLSDRESVYASESAADLHHWLLACQHPEDARALRAALATRSLALDWHTLERLRHDELAWDEMVDRFRHLLHVWRTRGVLPMVQSLLHAFEVPARLLNQTQDGPNDGERRLTDLLHLAELLQHASTGLEGEHALVRHLAEQREMAEQGEGGDAPILRLESDAQRVRVITVHKSKGLEYPVVFYPWASHVRTVQHTDALLRWHDPDGHEQLNTGGPRPERERVAALADQERLAEDLRKLYVGLTRARYATWLGVAPVTPWESSAIGHLVSGGEPLADDGWPEVLHQALGSSPHITVEPAPVDAQPAQHWVSVSDATGNTARVYRGQRRLRWWVASYSALRLADDAAHMGAEPTEPAVPDTAQDDLLLEPIAAVDPEPDAAPTGLHAFPRGAEAGTLLHDVLQWCTEQGWSAALQHPEPLADRVQRLCAAHGWEDWADTATQWLSDVLRADLPLPGKPALADLSTCQAEMEFWLGVAPASTRALDELVTQHTLGGAPRPALAADQLNGMLKGFMDLVFEHEGRYYVADYKSNWLGPTDRHYTAPALQQAVLQARYDLQYCLYLLALHRLLRQRLPDYDYDRHIGGAVYLFLRGWRGPAGGVFHERPPRALIESLDRLFEGHETESPLTPC